MKKTIITLIALLVTIGVYSQTFEWANSYGGTNNESGYSITLDASGNVYTTGYYNGTVDFDPGAGTTNLTSNGLSDVFVQKMDPQGDLLWAKSFGGVGHDIGYSIAIDASGNVYTAGYYHGTVDFDPGAGTTNLTSNGLSDVFVQKMDPQGDLLWVKSFGGLDYDIGYSITLDASGNAYTTGEFKGTVDFDPGAGTTDLSSSGFDDIFVQKMDPQGDLLWAKSFGGWSSDIANSIAVDASGNIYTAGHFRGTGNFDPGTGTTSLTSNGLGDVFVQKMDPQGNLLWAKSFGGTDADDCETITLDASGNVYTTGHFRGTVDFDPGAGTTNLTSNGDTDVFVHKMDSSGNLLWAESFGGSSNDFSRSISVGASGNVYTTGSFQGTVGLDQGAVTANLSSNGSTDIFVHKMDSSGTLLWAKSFGGPGYDLGNSITVDASDNVYTTGSFYDTVDFNPGSGTTNLSSNGSTDMFVHKMSQLTAGLIESSLEHKLTVYPNPTSGNFSIDLGAVCESSIVSIADISGKLIESKIVTQSQVLNLSIKEPAGIYFVSIQTGNKKATIGLVKE